MMTDQPQTIDGDHLKGVIESLKTQRNHALDTVAHAEGIIAQLRRAIAAQAERIEALMKQAEVSIEKEIRNAPAA